MSATQQPAKNSLLLDYLSLRSTTVLWTSFRAKHYPVVIAVVGSMAITFITIVSTGLIVLQATVVDKQNVTMFLASQFGDTPFNSSLVDGIASTAISSILSGNLSITYPPNTNSKYAVEPFRIASDFVGK